MIQFIIKNYENLISNFIVALIFLFIGLITPKAIRSKGNVRQIFHAIENKVYSLHKEEYRGYLLMLKKNNKCLIDLRTELIYKGITITIGICFIILIIISKMYLEIIHKLFIKDYWLWLIYSLFIMNLGFVTFRVVKYLRLRSIIKHLIKCPDDIKDFDDTINS